MLMKSTISSMNVNHYLKYLLVSNSGLEEMDCITAIQHCQRGGQRPLLNCNCLLCGYKAGILKKNVYLFIAYDACIKVENLP